MAADPVQKQRGRPWSKGVSGNPRGRAPGCRNRATVAAQALLDGEAEALTRKAVELALAGDTVALRLCLERILPPQRERPASFQLPALDGPGDLPAATAALVEAVAAGDLLPGAAAELAKLVEVHRRALETVELERRLAALEAAAATDGTPRR